MGLGACDSPPVSMEQALPPCGHPMTPMCGHPMAPGLIFRDSAFWVSRLGAGGREKALEGWWLRLLWPARAMARWSTFEPWSPRSPGLPASPT